MFVVLCSRSRSVDESSSRKKQNNGVSAIENQLSPPRDIRLPTWFQHDFLTQCWGYKRKARAELVASDSGFFVNFKDRSLNTSILHMNQKKTFVKQTGFCCTFPTIYKFSSWNKRSTCCPNYFPSFPKKLEAKQSCQSCPLAARNPLKSCAKFWPHRINKKNLDMAGHGTCSWCLFIETKMQPSKE